jgi:two-component system NtrC family response regulator
MSEQDIIEPEDLPPDIRDSDESKWKQNMNFQGMSLEQIEREAITQALEQHDGNQTRAAQALDIPRHVLLYRLKKYGIEL